MLTVNNKAHMVTLDYTVQVPGTGQRGSPDLRYPLGKAGGVGGGGVRVLRPPVLMVGRGLCCSKFRLSYYPHCLASFTELLQTAFGGKCQHSVLGDFKPYKMGQAYIPCYFIHVLKKTD